MCGWPGASSSFVVSVDVGSSGTKRKRSNDLVPNVGGSNRGDKWVLFSGVEHVTFFWYLGRPAVKTEKHTANKWASFARIDLRNGCWNTLASHCGTELLGAAVLPSFRQHIWVIADCGKLEAKLLKRQQEPSNKKFLWNLRELENCKLLKK